MDYHGSGIRGVADLHPAHEHEEWGGMIGNTVVWPGSELELSNLTLLRAAILSHQQVDNT